LRLEMPLREHPLAGGLFARDLGQAALTECRTQLRPSSFAR
jgi:hypothetical protein